jgi:3'-phosphoadenosine 5'-phosphosulfate (PAPS) 3'-phosphatase
MFIFTWIIPLFILVGASLSANALPPEISNHEWAERLSHALEMGREAGQAILRVKESKNLQTEIKADQTPVTKADRASNETICQLINQLYPEDGILSEETLTGEKALNNALEKGVHAEYTWVIDPLDGTKAFIKGISPNSLNLDPRYQGKYYGVHIGLLYRGTPILGVNYYPEIDTLYFSLDGFAYKQIASAPAERIIQHSLLNILPILNPTANERALVGKIYEKLLGKTEALEFTEQGLFLDSFGYKMICIAEGNQCNLFIAPAGGPGFWDVCSMVPFVQALGGRVTDWEGNPIDFQDMRRSGLLPKGVVISASPELHRQVISIIADLN